MTNVPEAGLLHRVHALGIALDELATWLDGPHLYPIDPNNEKLLRRMSGDLSAQVRQLEAEPALLTVVLMGGTGVGKSTLLNALAAGKVAESGLVRPTTQYPTVYHHRDVSLDRLDPVLMRCRAVPHDRPALRYKVLVDTPDIDGNVIAHRERLKEVLPIADAVLYVGSQEKYHDQAGWNLLLENRRSKGFAFVLNKWDRCLGNGQQTTGRSPDADLKKSLAEAGFDAPIVFRTVAGQWARQRLSGEADALGIADDFLSLENWLEKGLTDRAIRDIKMRGLEGKLGQIIELLERVIPPDWSGRAGELKRDWADALREGVTEHARLLVGSTDKHAAALELHFSRLGRGHIGGIFGAYLAVVDRLSQVNLSVFPRRTASGDSPIQELASRWVNEIPAQVRQSNHESLHNHLLVIADRKGWPIDALEGAFPKDVQALGEKISAQSLANELTDLEREFAEPTGGRWATRVTVRLLCGWTPWLILAFLAGKFLYDTFRGEFWSIGGYLTALILLALTMFLLHFIYSKTMPARWASLRTLLEKRIEDQLLSRISPVYIQSLDRFAQRIESEREKAIETLDGLRELRRQLEEVGRSEEQAPLFAQRHA